MAGASAFVGLVYPPGGATQHLLEFNDLASTQHRGRWGSYRAARIYIVEGQKELAEASLGDATMQRCHQFAAVLKSFCERNQLALA